jgi:hypothetical protein
MLNFAFHNLNIPYSCYYLAVSLLVSNWSAWQAPICVVVPDKRSRIPEVVVVRRLFNLGAGNLEWGGNGKGLRKGRSVYE